MLSVEGVAKTFVGRRPVEALRDVSLHVEAGDFVSIVGPSGCGKSTLFNLIAGIETPSSGRIAAGGETDADRRRLSCGYMFQKDLLFPWRSVLDNAALGLEVAGVCGRAEARSRARELLPRFGLEGFEGHRPAELSGGMRQRVALLRTLLLKRPLLLLDEPFASLDALTRRELQDWLRSTWRTGSEAALLVTHDVREAIYLSDRVYVMSPRPGSIVAEVAVPRGAGGSTGALAAAEVETAVLRALQIETAA
ncbi:MAG: ATP-binding cassette domain-containing protein [Dehalococcoidia bacterium]|nr:ATP-binding cassette domain-containing protein [Dehalococcoidia bacterium]